MVYYDPSGYNSCNQLEDNGADKYDEYLDDESPRRTRVGKQKGNAPRSNEKQNKQFRRAVKELGIEDDYDKRRRLHDDITGQGYDESDIVNAGKSLFD